MTSNYEKQIHKFSEDATAVHGDKYSYASTQYDPENFKYSIKCNTCKTIFWSQRNTHINRKQGCPLCNRKAKLSPEEMYNRLVSIHGDDYDYSEAVFQNTYIPFKVICKKTKLPFYPTFINHYYSGTKCPCCYGSLKKDTEIFITSSKKIWGDKFDYSKVKYENNLTKVELICKDHNSSFFQTPKTHFRGRNGCIYCSNKIPITTESFIQSANKVHGDGKYGYSQSNYITTDTKLKIECFKSGHGFFEQTPHNHVSLQQGCPKCGNNLSKPELEIGDFISQFATVQRRVRGILQSKELDIFLPDQKIAIEYNGLYWHSEKNVGKNYHLDKLIECNKNNIRLIHIFEDEWLEKPDIVKNRIKSILGIDEKVFARKTNIKIIDWKITSEFLDRFHIQGKGSPTPINLGLIDSAGSLVAVMTFSKYRFESSKENEFELVRYCSKNTIVGGFSKLLTYFIKLIKPAKVVSYSDRRWSIGNVYEKNGFLNVGTSDPGYFWVKGKKRYSRILFQKHKLKNVLEKFDESLTEYQNCIANGYSIIWDCGHDKWSLDLNK